MKIGKNTGKNWTYKLNNKNIKQQKNRQRWTIGTQCLMWSLIAIWLRRCILKSTVNTFTFWEDI